jgi:hypothetical protein
VSEVFHFFLLCFAILCFVFRPAILCAFAQRGRDAHAARKGRASGAHAAGALARRARNPRAMATAMPTAAATAAASAATLFERRMLKRGLCSALARVETARMVERHGLWDPRCAAAHADYPEEQCYTVRRMNKRVKVQVGCPCPLVQAWDAQTGEAEVFCSCRLGERLSADYAGECSDPVHFLMRDDLCVPGSQAPRGARARGRAGPGARAGARAAEARARDGPGAVDDETAATPRKRPRVVFE